MKAMVERARALWRAAWPRLRPYTPICGVFLFVACAQLPWDPQHDVGTLEESFTVDTSDLAPIAPQSVPLPTTDEMPVTEVAAIDPPFTNDVGDGGISPAFIPPKVDVPKALEMSVAQQAAVDSLCAEIGNKLGSVSVEDCNKHGFREGQGSSVQGRPLLVKDVMPGTTSQPEFRVLIMGGIHGDEYSAISILFKWLDLFSAQRLEGEFRWRVAPLVNPDGLLGGTSASRQNANGVDLNRNFPSRDWNDDAVSYWRKSTGSNPRRFPGEQPASEPEVQWLVNQIEEFEPHVIVSLHAPFHLLDFDGPAAAPEKIGELQLRQLGVYPGSLGNYAGLNKLIPVVTLELPSAGSLPSNDQITLMWNDLVAWLDREGRKRLLD
jgi:protein MpaA